jgi:predicted small metal-binding protein
MKEIRCRDAGVACDFVAQAETIEELMKKVREHAQKDHGYKEIPPELAEKVKTLVHDVKA